jgi:hypothetical protein
MKDIVKFFLGVVLLVVLWKNLDTLLYIGNMIVNTICDKAIEALK